MISNSDDLSSKEGRDLRSIAIVGLSCRLPGDGDTPANFWDFVCKAKSAYGENPDRFVPEAFHYPGKKFNTNNARGAHFVKQDVSLFDANFFKLPKVEAESMDPQQRMLAEVAFEALENAGLPLSTMAGTRTGVFVASMTDEYREIILRDPETVPAYSVNGAGAPAASNRISWLFDLKGPSMTVNTACSSSLVCVHLACQSLLSGECDTAIVGAQNLLLNPDMFLHLSNQQFLAPDGKCKPFDASADGYGRGEGIAAIVLRRVDEAVSHGDPIRAVIRGTACNQDGRTKGFTMPSADAQERLISDAYVSAGLDMSSTRYVEAHGTGTQAGDSEEATGLSRTFSKYRSASDRLLVGSVKSNIGHLESSAGLASMIKLVFMLETGLVPPTIHHSAPNPKIKWDDWNLAVPMELTPWPSDGLRRASTQGFGFGGTNAHIILDDAYHYLLSRGVDGHQYCQTMTPVDTSGPSGMPRLRVFALTAEDKDGLKRVRTRLSEHLSKIEGTNRDTDSFMRDLAYTLAERRTSLQWRSFVVAGLMVDLTKSLLNKSPPVQGRALESPRLAFVFTGQGAQWARMGIELFSFTTFRQSVEGSDEFLRRELACPWSALEELAKAHSSSNMELASHSQPLCTILQVALVDLLDTWNIKPSCVTGHSSGEIAAAYCLGVLSKESALRVAYYRGYLSAQMKTLAPEMKGGMAAIGASSEEVLTWLDELEHGEAAIACVNSPSSITVSGDAAAIDELVAKLTPMGVFARKLKVDTAYHSPHMQIISEEYRAVLENLDIRAASDGCSMFSALLGGYIEPDQLGASHWVQNLVSPVLFSDAVTDMVLPWASGQRSSDKNVDILLEIGPHSALQGPVKQTLDLLGIGDVPYYSMLSRGKDALQTALTCAGSLHALGVQVDLTRVNDPGSTNIKPLVDLPPYPWNHLSSFWSEARIGREFRLRKHPRQPLLGAPTPTMSMDEMHWRGFVRPAEEPWLCDHRIQGSVLYPAAGFLAMAIEAAAQIADPNRAVFAYRLRDVVLETALTIPEDSEIECILTFRPHRDATLQSGSTWTEFSVSSSAGGEPLRQNCYGLIVTDYEAPEGSGAAVERELAAESVAARHAELEGVLQAPLAPSKLYKYLDAIGLQYGPAFARVTSVRRDASRPGWCVGEVESCSLQTLVPPSRHLRPHIIHPTVLDAAFHLAFAALYATSDELSGTMVPSKIDEVVVLAKVPWEPGSVVRGYSHARRHGFREVVADMEFPDAFSIHGFTCASLGNAGPSDDEAEARQLAFSLKWEPCVRLLTPEQLGAVLQGSIRGGNPPAWQMVEKYLDLLRVLQPNLAVLELAPDGSPILGQDSAAKRILNTASIQICVADDQAATTAAARLGALERSITVTSADPSTLPGASFDVILAPEGSTTSQVLKQLLKPGGSMCLLGNWDVDGEPFGPVLSLQGSLRICGAPSVAPASDAGSKVVLIEAVDASPSASSVADTLTQLLQNSGLDVRRTTWDCDATAFEGRVCIILAEMERPLLSRLSEADFRLVKELVLRSRSVFWVTAFDLPDAVMFSGLARSVRNEIPGTRIRSLRLAPSLLTCPAQVASLIDSLVFADVADEEFNVTPDGIPHVSRVEQDTGLNADLDGKLSGRKQTVMLPLADLGHPHKLGIRQPGMLDTLALEYDPIPLTELGEGLVEVEMKVTSLNFRDVMVAMGQIPDDKLGFEGAGVIRRLGPGVSKFQVGDRVCVVGHGAHRTVHRVRAEYCELVPTGMSMEEAATLPLVHSTAWYGLVKTARAEAGQSILIHAAAGGVGQAAIQLAKHIGMEIYATVGSEDKKALIQAEYGIQADHIFNSRDLSFAAGIKRMTRGRGVDVVLNSLTGEALRQTWHCIAPFGTFVDIGMKDILINSRLDMRPFLQDATYAFFNLNRVENHRPDLMSETISGTFQLLRSGITRPVHPITTYPVSQVEQAFRLMQMGKHRGKVALSLAADDVVPVLRSSDNPVTLDPGATYMLVGGFGGLGRSLARMFFRRGARRICFVSRSGAASPDAVSLVAELEQGGARVKTLVCDVASPEAVAAAVDECTRELGPVRGVVQCAMVLRDVLFEKMTFEDWTACTTPKVQGTWNLHQCLRDVDFFIVLSSFAGIIGNRGQGNYAAAGSYEDELAHHRRSLGLPCVTIDLGIMREVGVLAEKGLTDNLREWEEPFGIGEAEFHALIEHAIAHPGTGAQLPTGFGTAGAVATAGIGTPFYFDDPRFGILANVGAKASGSAGVNAASLSHNIAAAPSQAAAVDIVTGAIVERLAKLLSMEQGDIDVNKPLHSFGVDSLVAVEFANWIFKEMKVKVTVLEVLSHEPIRELGLKIISKYTVIISNI